MIYITGSSGYIGSSLSKILQKKNICFETVNLRETNFEKRLSLDPDLIIPNPLGRTEQHDCCRKSR